MPRQPKKAKRGTGGGKRPQPKAGGRSVRAKRRPPTVRRPTAAGAKRSGAKPAKQPFPGLRKEDGCGAMIVVVEKAGDKWDELRGVVEIRTAPAGGAKGRGAAGHVQRAARALAAVGHVQRLKIMLKLIEGPATYQALQRATRLRAGPLYHHVNQLRMAGLILPKQRDLYESTRGGRNLILLVMAAEASIKDARRRPVAGVS